MPEPEPPVLQGTVVERFVNAKRHPVVPAWIRDDVTRRAAVKYAARHYAHKTVFHGSRSPKYATRLVVFTPRGGYRLLGRAAGWVLDAEAAPLREHAATQKDVAQYLKLRKISDGALVNRLTGLAVSGCIMAGGVLLADWLWWPYAWVPVLAAAVGTLGFHGRPLHRPFLDTAADLPRNERLTQDIVTRALGSIGIANINAALRKGGDGIRYASVPHRDGPGWRVDAELPHGVTALEVIERRDKLASGLRRPLSCVWPEPAPDEHEGRLVLWVGDVPLSKAVQPRYPLLKAGSADAFKPVPYGTDQRMRPITLELMFANLLIGSIPRRGKTMAMRIVLLAMALDVRCELRVFELKGTGDLSAFGKVAHHYGSGADDETKARALASLAEIYAELDRRAKTIRGLPKDLCPENKVTPELARRKSLRLHPLVFALDECQEAFSDPDLGAEFDRLATAIIKRGPALGIMLLLATQRPDAKSLPTGITSNVSIRFCLQVMDQLANDMVLGTSAYKKGVNATLLTKNDKGCGWLVGASETPLITRTYLMDAPAAELVCDRARAARAQAGTLTGEAAGEVTEAPVTVSLIADVAAVMGGEERLWNETICARLAELRPGLYGGWDAAQLGRALAALGVVSAQTWARDGDGQGRNRQGIARADLMAVNGTRA